MVWEVRKLGDVCDLYQPKTISSKDMISNGQYPVFGANGLIGRYDKYNHEEPQLLITCRGATCGTINISEPRSWITGNSMVVKPKVENLDLNFLRYLLIGGVNLNSAITGAAQPQITRQSLSPVQISYSDDIQVQKQIVAILDEAFFNIDRARQFAECNLKNARKLFDSILKAIFESVTRNQFANNDLEALCELIVDCEHKTAPTEATGYPSIRTPNIKRGILSLENVNKVSEETYREWTRRAVPLPGDLIMAREAPAGNVAVIPDGIQPCLGQRTLLIRPKSEIFISEYLMWYLLSPEVQTSLLSTSRGATVQHVNMKDIRALEIKDIPELSEQKRIADSIEDIRLKTKKLEVIYQQKITALDELKQSLLQKAFRGELTQGQAAA